MLAWLMQHDRSLDEAQYSVLHAFENSALNVGLEDLGVFSI